MAESILKVDVKVYTANGWTVREWPDGWIEAHKRISGSITHYYQNGGFYGYNTEVTFPFTMANTDYSLTQEWQIGSGFSMAAAALGHSKTGSRLYALGTASGTQNYTCWLCLKGYKA